MNPPRLAPTEKAGENDFLHLKKTIYAENLSEGAGIASLPCLDPFS